MRFTVVGNAFANIYVVTEQFAGVFVRDILETHHEMTATHVADQRKPAELVETLFKIGAYLSNVTANIELFHDFDILEAGTARDRMTGIGEPMREPGVRIRTGNDFIDSVAEEGGSQWYVAG